MCLSNKSSLLQTMPKYSLLDGQYEVKETIGSGGFAKVKLGVHVLTGEKVAIKMMDKNYLGDEIPRVYAEIEAMKDLLHQNICKLYQVIETDDKFFMILEYCCGGELFDYITDNDRLPEEEALLFFRQIVSAMAYIHDQGYVHRDLKPENLLLDENQNLKLIDFGLCTQPKGGMQSQLDTCCGSPAYAAPELIEGKQYVGSEADIWSLGVLLYALLCGYLPFDGNDTACLYKKIQAGRYEIPNWVSDESARVIHKLLQHDPKCRATMKDLLEDPWVTKGSCGPVSWKSQLRRDVLDDECLTSLSILLEKSKNELVELINEWKYDYITASYLLLLNKKVKQFGDVDVMLNNSLNTESADISVVSGCLDPTCENLVMREMESGDISPTSNTEGKIYDSLTFMPCATDEYLDEFFILPILSTDSDNSEGLKNRMVKKEGNPTMISLVERQYQKTGACQMNHNSVELEYFNGAENYTELGLARKKKHHRAENCCKGEQFKSCARDSVKTIGIDHRDSNNCTPFENRMKHLNRYVDCQRYSTSRQRAYHQMTYDYQPNGVSSGRWQKSSDMIDCTKEFSFTDIPHQSSKAIPRRSVCHHKHCHKSRRFQRVIPSAQQRENRKNKRQDEERMFLPYKQNCMKCTEDYISHNLPVLSLLRPDNCVEERNTFGEFHPKMQLIQDAADCQVSVADGPGCFKICSRVGLNTRWHSEGKSFNIRASPGERKELADESTYTKSSNKISCHTCECQPICKYSFSKEKRGKLALPRNLKTVKVPRSCVRMLPLGMMKKRMKTVRPTPSTCTLLTTNICPTSKSSCRGKTFLKNNLNAVPSHSRSFDSQLNNLSLMVRCSTPVNDLVYGSVDRELNRLHLNTVDIPGIKSHKKSILGNINLHLDRVLCAKSLRKKMQRMEPHKVKVHTTMHTD